MLRAQAGVGGVLSWIIGTLNGRVWVHWEQLWPWAVVALPLAAAGRRGHLIVLQLGDSVAASRGMRVNVTRTALFCLAALLTAAAVSVVGAVGFLGLVAPHIARWLTGEDARRLLPVAAVAGAALLVGADIVSQGITIRPPFPTPHAPAGASGWERSWRSSGCLSSSISFSRETGAMMQDTAVLDAKAVSVRLGKSPVLNDDDTFHPTGDRDCHHRSQRVREVPPCFARWRAFCAPRRAPCCWMAQPSPGCLPARWRGRSRRYRSRRAPFRG